MIRKETFEDLSFLFLKLFWILTPFSVSLSQICFGSAVVFSLVFSFLEGKMPKLPIAFFLWIGLYLSFLVYPLLYGSEVSIFQLLTKTEFGDIWMGFVFFLIPLNPKKKEQISRFIRIGGILLISVGFFSLFFPYRLSTFVMDGFKYIDGRRLPHLLYQTEFGLGLYLPIGFQNTHLTFGALLAFYLPPILYQSYRLFKWKLRSLRFWSFLSLPIVGILLLFLNQSRSILLGLSLSYLLILGLRVSYLKTKWKQLTVFFLFLSVLVFSLYQFNWLFKRAIDDLFAKQSLENQRTWIHKINFQILSENPIHGIGAGTYSKKFESIAKQIVQENPQTYYDLSITPKSHAHFDALEFAILGGIFGFFFYFAFVNLILIRISKMRRKRFLYVGIYAILFAGISQCFLLDDETLLPFLVFISPQLQNLRMPKIHWNSHQSFFSIYLVSALGFAYSVSKTPISDLFLHRVRHLNNTISTWGQNSTHSQLPIPLPGSFSDLKYEFKLEGCLDTEINFGEKGAPRKKPIVVQLDLTEFPRKDLDTKIFIHVRKRESFDQDQMYKLHREWDVSSFPVQERNSIVSIAIDPTSIPNYTNKPEFVDFGFRYEFGKNSSRQIYPIVIEPNCN